MTRAISAFRVSLALFSVVSIGLPAAADQGGISFWLPGTFGSFAATPLNPGLSWATIYLHSDVRAGGNVAASRAVRFGNQTTNLSVNLNAELKAKADVGLFGPTYVASTPVLGGQFSMSVLGIYGRQHADITANITGALGPIGFAATRSVSQQLDAWGDVFLRPTLTWHHGVHNYIAYGLMNLPVGAYDARRLVNLGLGHWSIDGGGGYTYFDPHQGVEFSVVSGLTYNFENTHLQYQNGVDWHVDWGTSKMLNEHVFVGAVGYFYQQLSPDSGAGATFGAFRSRVAGIGPQVGFLFPVGDMQGALNIKGYKEFAAENRPEGWNTWVAFSLSPKAEPRPASVTPPLRRKY